MAKYTFMQYLTYEVAAARCALLLQYEKRDELIYIERARLEKEYMDKIGKFEETVVKEEIECELLELKQKMIQTAINRNEPIDLQKIDKTIDQERERLMREAGGNPPQEYAELDPEQEAELKELYHKIVQEFHPQMHPELTEMHRRLFLKAQDAYRRKDIEALRLIYEMMTAVEGSGIEIELLVGLLDEEPREKNIRPDRDYEMDFGVAKLIFGCFMPRPEEAAIREEWNRYLTLSEEVMVEMNRIRSDFPFTAAEMLSSEEQLEEYREELSVRQRAAQLERARRTKEIESMLKGVDVIE